MTERPRVFGMKPVSALTIFGLTGFACFQTTYWFLALVFLAACLALSWLYRWAGLK